MSKGFRSFIRSQDVFGYKLGFHYKKHQTFKSLFGGIMTILFILIVSLYFALQLVSIHLRESSQLNRSTQVRKHGNNYGNVTLTSDQLDIAISILCQNDKEVQEAMDQYLQVYMMKSDYTLSDIDDQSFYTFQ